MLLHSEPVNWPRLHRFDPRSLWENARPALISGQPALVFSPTDQVLFLRLQADNHGVFNREELGATPPDELLFAEWSNNRLVRFVDLFEVLRSQREEIDWHDLVKRAWRSVIEESVFTSLTLTDTLLGPTVDPSALAQLRSARKSRVEGWIPQALATGRFGEGSGTIAAGVARWIWSRLRPRFHVELVYFIRLAEYCLPSPFRLARCSGIQRRESLLVAYVMRAGHGLFRSMIAFLVGWVQRIDRRTERRRMVERGITPEIAADVAHDQLGRGFRRASSRSGDATRTSFYLFAGRAVRPRIVGGPLVQRLARPFAHLAAQRPRRRQSHLTIDLWDETSTGVGLRERPRGSASSGRPAIGVSLEGAGGSRAEQPASGPLSTELAARSSVGSRMPADWALLRCSRHSNPSSASGIGTTEYSRSTPVSSSMKGKERSSRDPAARGSPRYCCPVSKVGSSGWRMIDSV